jgi:O-6-methylguanine DNA methyltransferase
VDRPGFTLLPTAIGTCGVAWRGDVIVAVALPDVHEVVRGIAPGLTLTYGEVAARVGEPGAAQAVGRAMGSNPVPIIVPCHRVVGAGGRPVGYSAPGGVATKQRILRIEGAAAGGHPSLFEPAPGAPTTALGR